MTADTPTHHNHKTRELQPRGVCPKCDELVAAIIAQDGLENGRSMTLGEDDEHVGFDAAEVAEAAQQLRDEMGLDSGSDRAGGES